MRPQPMPTQDGADPATVWTTWHLHLASRARSVYDRVLLEAVAPVVGARDRPWFFLRYWQGGPHVRLRVGDLDPAAQEEAEAELAGRLAQAGVLREGEEPVDPAAYREDAARMVVTETIRPDGAEGVEELRPPGVYRAAYEPEFDRYGGVAFMPASERLFGLSSELALALLPHAPETQHRMMLAVRATVSAAAATGGPAEQERFYRGGLDFWRDWVAASSALDAERIDRLCAMPAAGRTPDPGAHGPFGGWHEALAELAARLAGAGRPPGPVLLSHVHMFCNRIGRSLIDEMQTYAWLVRTLG